jgi:hypothetical protein
MRVAAAIALGALACGREAGSADVRVRAIFQAPATVQCLRITAAGATRTRTFDFEVASGQPTHDLSLRGAPTGNVLFFGSAFAAGCSATASAEPTWIADAVVQSLTAGQSAALSLVFRPNGAAQVAVDFQDDQRAAATLAGSGRAGDADGMGTAAQFSSPSSVALGAGVAYVADAGNGLLRSLDLATRQVTTLRPTGPPFVDLRGLAVAGTDLWATDGCAIWRIDPALSTRSLLLGDPACRDAAFGALRGVVALGTELFVADAGRNVIRKVALDPTPTSSIFAGQSGVSGAADGAAAQALFSGPEGLATDGRFLYVADRGNCTVRLVSLADGRVSTLAGLAGSCAVFDDVGSAARFSAPSGIATDGRDVFVSDPAGQTLRRIDLEFAAVVTVAGTAGSAGQADGRGFEARFSSPALLALDATGVLYVADSGNHQIRTVSR